MLKLALAPHEPGSMLSMSYFEILAFNPWDSGRYAFAAVLEEGGKVVAWGDVNQGGDVGALATLLGCSEGPLIHAQVAKARNGY